MLLTITQFLEALFVAIMIIALTSPQLLHTVIFGGKEALTFFPLF